MDEIKYKELKEYYVLMILKRSIPTNIGQDLGFESIGGIGCLLVFDSLDALREVSPDGQYVMIQKSNLKES